jgi:phosphoglucomutase
VVGGDGRYWTRDAVRIIARVAAGNGVSKLLVGRNGILCTPAVSAVIRARSIFGGIILTASHNPGGPDKDFGVKYNMSNGGPAPDSVTTAIYEATKSLTAYKYAVRGDGGRGDPFAGVDLDKVGISVFRETTAGAPFTVEIIDSADDYVALLKSMFDFDKLRALFARRDFAFLFDAMSGVTGPYARRIFVEELGGPESCLMRAQPLEDFGGCHPDPNLTYAADLVAACDPSKVRDAPDVGAASDGDGDRNMILGRGFFVNPSDSVAVIAAKGPLSVPWLSRGLRGVARSMPTAGALDQVARKLGIEMHEVPTGWKYFGSLMDAGRAQICGEESFGTGSDHVREKDGVFAVLCWLSIVARESEERGELVSVERIVREHWREYGRNFFSRYDYEGVCGEAANAMMAHLTALQARMNANREPGSGMRIDGGEFPALVKTADNFAYTDPVDGSIAIDQGIRFVFEDDSRIIFRLSGTGSSGATVRLYVEKYEPDVAAHDVDARVALKPFIDVALRASKLEEFTGRSAPTVVT